MNCIHCKKHVTEVNLFRTNPPGQNPDWMCEDCIIKIHDKSLIPKDIKNITNIFKNDNQHTRQL